MIIILFIPLVFPMTVPIEVTGRKTCFCSIYKSYTIEPPNQMSCAGGGRSVLKEAALNVAFVKLSVFRAVALRLGMEGVLTGARRVERSEEEIVETKM